MNAPPGPCGLAFGLLALFATAASGQQFISSPLPGPVVWSEAAVPLDADGDGLLDVLIINANGWNIPGDFDAPSTDPLPPTLLRNTGVVGEDPVFVDASATFLPAGLVLHGKAAAVADFDGDGHDDIALAAAFGDQQRLLRKEPMSGAWVDETATRLPALVLNGWSVAAGDLDDDGDMDLVFADAGPNSFDPPGGLARLLINDGTGVFTDAPAQLGAVLKVGAQNVKLVDIDNDLDLDVVVDGKSKVTQLYLNDGAAQFTLQGGVIPDALNNISFGTYETEFADLDGDDDFDAFMMNYSLPFVDSFLVNNLNPTGTLDLRPLAAVMVGPNSEDENDFAYLDADDDGDLDLLVGALDFSAGPPQPEKLFVNSGTVSAGMFTNLAGAFDVAPDATLDLGLGDFDDDGDYDVVSVQGEFVPFGNVYHRNIGPADSRAPEVRRLSPAPATLPLAQLAGGWPRRAWIQDALVDDETVYLTADLVIDTLKAGEAGGSTTAMAYVGGALWRGLVDPAPSSQGLVGMDVSYRVEGTDPAGNTGVSATETVRLCGVEPYGTAGPDADLQLTALGDATIGQPITLEVTGGTPSVPGTLIVGAFKTDLPFASGTLLVDPGPAILIALALDGTGGLSLPASVPDDDIFVGVTALVQYVAFDGSQPQGHALSNALEIVVCGP